MGEWRYSSTILDFSARWRRVVSFKRLPLYTREQRPQYPFYRRLGRPKVGPNAVEKRKIFYPNENRTSSLHIRHTLAKIKFYNTILIQNKTREHAWSLRIEKGRKKVMAEFCPLACEALPPS
jgi:hypothetical protein